MSGGLTSRCEQEILRLEQYLPLLEDFISRADVVTGERQMIQWTSQLKIRWSSALSSSSFFDLMGPKFYQVDNLQFELAMTLFLYGAVLRERALDILPTDVKQSAFTFRQAAGVFHYLAQEAIYIRRAEERGATGFGVLSKLHHGVAELLGEATGCALHSGTGEGKAISSRFLEFISSCRALHELRGNKYLAEGIKKDDQIGVAIGVLREALIDAKTKTPTDDSWRAVFTKEIESAMETLRKYEHENEFVWHEKIASGDDLSLPQGKKIVEMEPYRPIKWEREVVFKF